MVRANYNNLKKGIHETTEYLELFLRNLLLDEKNELHNRSMHISGTFSVYVKADIDMSKADIEVSKANIENKLKNVDKVFLSKTREHILMLYEEYGFDKVFGRTMVEQVTGLKATRTSELIKIMLDNGIIEPVRGYGKGKYRFKNSG